jgi:transposase InsO family protein
MFEGRLTRSVGHETRRPGPETIGDEIPATHDVLAGKAELIESHALDAWSRRVVGWSIADHIRSELVVAFWSRKPDVKTSKGSWKGSDTPMSRRRGR